MKTPEGVVVNISTENKRVFEIVGTLLLCAAVGMTAYALAENGWIEIAASRPSAIARATSCAPVAAPPAKTAASPVWRVTASAPTKPSAFWHTPDPAVKASAAGT